jgi:ketosteroid isomerase-like protein
MTRRALPALLFAAAGARAASSKKQAAALEAIKKADRDFCEATKARGLEGWMSFFAADATAFPAGRPLITGKEKLREFYAGMFSTPEFSLTWNPVKGDMAASADLGYTIGVAEVKYRGKDGQMVQHPTKYLTVWKKQADGSWKVAADLGN